MNKKLARQIEKKLQLLDQVLEDIRNTGLDPTDPEL
jgi:hypothetical protein